MTVRVSLPGGSRSTPVPVQSVAKAHERVPVGLDRSALEQCPWLVRYPRRQPGPRGLYLRVKRSLDLLVVMGFSLIWLPVVGVCWLAIKASDPSSPAVFRQLRTGRGGRRTAVHKFRTMVPDADALKASLQHLNVRTWPDFKLEKDPRVTRLGKVFRPTSVDELPQLIDVLRGSMSLVGPRPTSLAPDGYQPWQLERFTATGGITGLWQVTGRDNPSFVERVRLDVAYVDRRCLRLDLEILLRTVPAVIRRRNAH